MHFALRFFSRAAPNGSSIAMAALLSSKHFHAALNYVFNLARAVTNPLCCGPCACSPQWGIAMAALLCHRFFSRKSMKRNDRHVSARD